MFQNLRRLAERFTVPDDELPPGGDMDYDLFTEAADTGKERLTIGTSTYTVDKQSLGSGTYGSVFRVHSIEPKSTSIWKTFFNVAFGATPTENDSTRKYVMKKTTESQAVGFNASFIREINALQNLRDVPNIIQIYDFGYEYDQGIVIMEAGTTDLRTLLANHAISNRRLSNRKSIMYKIVSAMRAMTLRGFWHRDLKPQNIVITPEGPKIIDFGICRMGPHEDIQGTNLVYTLWYRPPELLLRSQHLAHLYDGDKCDVWSVAMVFLDILTLGRRTLFTTRSRSDEKVTEEVFIANQMKEIYEDKNLEYVKVEKGQPFRPPPSEKLWTDLWKGRLTPVLERILQPYDESERKDLIDLLLKMMAPHPTNRASYDDVLQHNYFKTETPIPTPTLPQMQGDYKIVSEDVNIRMYTILAEWLYEVWFRYKLRKVTYIQGMALIRKVLSVYPVSGKDLQLIGCVCMHLSSMLYEVFAPDPVDWRNISKKSFTLEKFHETLFTIFRDELKGNLRVFSAYDVLRTRCSTLAQLNGILRLVALCDMMGLHYYLQSQEAVLSIAGKIKRIIEEEEVFKNIEKNRRMEKLKKVVSRVFEDEKNEFKGLKIWWKGTKENTKDLEYFNRILKTFSSFLAIDWVIEELEQKIVCTTEEKSNDDRKLGDEAENESDDVLYDSGVEGPKEKGDEKTSS